jgi:imidazoleglycerol-phosphate dehydratase
MLSTLAAASGLRLEITCHGDLFIDDHHSTEDVCIALGQCLHTALGTKAGCNRMAWAAAEEGGHKVEVAIDLSNRPHFQHDLRFETEMVRSTPPGLPSFYPHTRGSFWH